MLTINKLVYAELIIVIWLIQLGGVEKDDNLGVSFLRLTSEQVVS